MASSKAGRYQPLNKAGTYQPFNQAGTYQPFNQAETCNKMASSSSRIEIFLYFGGELSSDGWSVTYDQTPIAAMRIPRSSSYDQFLSKIYKKIGVDSSRFSLNVSAKHSCQYLGRIKETLIPIKDDDTLSFFTDPTTGFSLMEIFVETVEIQHDDAPQIGREALIEAVKERSLRYARREYWVPESSKTKWKVLCRHTTEAMRCRWELRGIYKPKMGRWTITKYGGDHTCILNQMSLEHGNLDRVYVASLLLGHVKCNPSYGIKHVIQTVKDHTGYDIAYQKAWYSLKMAREMVYGTWESSVQKLPKYLGALQKYNPGTIVEWQHKARDTSTGAYVIGYVFWAFKPCIEGFQHCRNLISVDETHLYTKYKHKMLIAAAMDGNQQVLPLAFAVVDEESLLSWKWFLRQLSRHIIRGRRGICLISDRHAGITRAVRECPDFVPPNGVHRYCLRHVCSNFNSKYKNVVLKDLCWRAGSEYQIRKFNRTMEEIKKQSLEAFQWLDRIDKEKWTASHDGGWRCGILTTNMSECINGVLKGARRLPLTAIAEMTFQRSVHYFRERLARSTVMLTNNQLWTDFAYKMFTRWHQNSVEHTVTKFHQFQQSASVVTRRHGGHGVNTHVVKIANRECSCGKWTQFGLPCSHARKVCAAFMINAASMVKDYYDIMTYKNTYSKSFEPVHSEDYWDVPGFELVHDPTIRISSRPGRNQTIRIYNEMDWAQRRARQQAQQRNSSTQSDVPVPGSQD
ncbi:uncharacterized protein LOC105178424 [Sesamum indicum]|uniref:Uncharacterized protein LOC105178424 n=1 Tax=Sesamum indicum TaxID=4182 RepID=A0A6I9UYE7_SESIN|nr:uncharacterized protein LOC105178424 [Sesamum indicum]